MPEYLFKNPDTGEVKSVFQKMEEEHSYEESGVKWQRVWTVPQTTTDTNVDPFSVKDFLKKTQNASKLGDLWDRSKEMSIKREEKIGGEDPLKRSALNEYSESRRGKKHPLDK